MYTANEAKNINTASKYLNLAAKMTPQRQSLFSNFYIVRSK